MRWFLVEFVNGSTANTYAEDESAVRTKFQHLVNNSISSIKPLYNIKRPK